MFLLFLDGHVKGGAGSVLEVCSQAWSHWHVAKPSGGCGGALSVEGPDAQETPGVRWVGWGQGLPGWSWDSGDAVPS